MKNITVGEILKNNIPSTEKSFPEHFNPTHIEMTGSGVFLHGNKITIVLGIRIKIKRTYPLPPDTMALFE